MARRVRHDEDDNRRDTDGEQHPHPVNLLSADGTRLSTESTAMADVTEPKRTTQINI
jgi:hypothetical protein